jgi:hypothetical protein
VLSQQFVAHDKSKRIISYLNMTRTFAVTCIIHYRYDIDCDTETIDYELKGRRRKKNNNNSSNDNNNHNNNVSIITKSIVSMGTTNDDEDKP